MDRSNPGSGKTVPEYPTKAKEHLQKDSTLSAVRYCPETGNSLPETPEEVAIRFLEVLYEGTPGFIEVRLIQPSGGTTKHTFKTFKEAAQFALASCDNHNVYMGTATQRTPDTGKGSGKKENRYAARHLWFDWDADEGMSREEFRSLLRALPMEPSMLVNSGNGYHGYIRLEEAFIFDGPESIAEFETVLAGLVDYLGCDTKRVDVASILRVPPTDNIPNEVKKKKGRVRCITQLLEESDASYAWEELSDLFKDRGESLAPKKNGQREENVYESLPWDGNLPESVEAVLKEDNGIAERLRQRWFHANTERLHDKTDSGIDFSVCSLLLLLEVTPHEVEWALKSLQKTVRKLPLKEDHYYRQTVKRCVVEEYSKIQDELRKLQRGGVPEITISGRHVADITEECLAVLQKANKPPSLFKQTSNVGQHMQRLTMDSEGSPVLQRMDQYAVSALLHQLMRPMRHTKQVDGEGKRELLPAQLSERLIKEMLAGWDLPLPVARGITGVPIMRQDGTLVTETGFDEVTGLIYQPDDDLVVPEIPTNPSADEIRGATQLLQEVTCDFPFEGKADRANYFALLLTVCLRPTIKGNVPMGSMDAPAPGTGKSLLAEVLQIIGKGRAGASAVPNGQVADREWTTTISAQLSAGNPVVCFDNAPEGVKIDNADLAKLLTSDTETDCEFRRYGKNDELLRYRNYSVWLITGNNLTYSFEIARRVVHVRLDAKSATPHENREPFRHPNLKDWVRQNRGAIVTAALTLGRAWFAAGKPKGSISEGSYEQWSEMLGGIMDLAGIEGFLENRKELLDGGMGSEYSEWADFLYALHFAYPSVGFTGNMVYRDLEVLKGGCTPQTQALYEPVKDALPAHVLDAYDRGEGRFVRVLGSAFRGKKEQRFTVHTEQGDKVVRISTTPPGQSSGPSPKSKKKKRWFTYVE